MREYSGGREGVNDSTNGSTVDMNVRGLRVGIFRLLITNFTPAVERDSLLIRSRNRKCA